MVSFNDIKKSNSRISRVIDANKDRVKKYSPAELKQLVDECLNKMDTYEGNLSALSLALSLSKDEQYKSGLFNMAILNLRDRFQTRLSLSFLVGLVDRTKTNKYKLVREATKEVGLKTMPMRVYHKQGYQEQLRHRVKTYGGMLDFIFTSEEWKEARDRLVSWRNECIEKSVKPEALQLVFTD